VWSLAPDKHHDRNHHLREAISLWCQHKKIKFFHSIYTWGSCVSFFFCASLVMTGVQTVEMSKLGWLIGWSSRDMWADSLYCLYVVLAQSARPSLHSNAFYGLPLMHVRLILIFQTTPVSGYTCAPMCMLLFVTYCRKMGVRWDSTSAIHRLQEGLWFS
jgi:hypothetical protein